MSYVFQITILLDGKAHVHSYRPSTIERALGAAHELVRDKQAEFVRVDRVLETHLGPANGDLLEKYSKEMEFYSCAFCPFEGMISKTRNFTRCPNCGSG
jgi:rubrerythrin